MQLYPAGQALQNEADVLLYVPFEHGLQEILRATEYVPALQATGASFEFAHLYPAGHGLHVVLPF